MSQPEDPAGCAGAQSRPAEQSIHPVAERYLFYCFDPTVRAPLAEPTGYPGFSVKLWKPSLRRPWPSALPRNKRMHFLFRTALHLAARFPDGGSGAMLIYDGGRAVHYSAFTSRYWRFLFLEPGDVQVGDTWTDPSYRGRGLAKQTLRRLLMLLSKPGRRIWYVVEDINRASIKVAEVCGFELAGIGNRTARLKALDRYQIVMRWPIGLPGPAHRTERAGFART